MIHLVRALALPFAAASLVASCQCGAPVPPPAGILCGSGTVDNAPFAIDPAQTRLIIVARRNDGAGCGVFHNHVVNATIAALEYNIDSSDPGKSTVKVTVRADGLVPDTDALRDEFLTNASPPLDGPHLSASDQASIRGSVAAEVEADTHPTLVFTISNISSVSGAGTAKMKADLAGASSTVDVNYNIKKDGTTFTIKDGTATLEGAPYGIPRNSLGFCVNPTMAVHFDLVLTQADATPVCDIGTGQAYKAKDFGDTSCAPNVSFNEVREVAVRRCAGCHAAELRLGATVPLTKWEDFQTDSLRAQGKPLYQTASDYIHLDPTTGGLSMPPQTDGLATPLTSDEIALFDAWVTDGARNAKCADDVDATVFPRIAHKQCDAFHSNAVDANPSAGGNTPSTFFNGNCGYCHADATTPPTYPGVPQISAQPVAVDNDSGNAVIDHAIAQGPVHHAFYQGDDGDLLSFWEASVQRYLDNSMLPGGELFDTTVCASDADCAGSSCYVPTSQCVDPGFIAFSDWVANGYPEAECP
ncbi:MAG TPA: hypothetical protein VGO62_08510 [Myxococcota bacterium]